MTIRGVIHGLPPEEMVGAQKNLRKRILHLRNGSAEYPEDFFIEFLKDGCDELNGLAVGQEVEADYWMNGRLWTNPTSGEVKNFITLKAAGPVKPLNAGQQQPAGAAAGGGGGYFSN